MGGKGAVVYMRGIAGHPADTDRDKGFKKALAENPGITIAKETVDQVGPGDRRPTRSTTSCASGTKFDGIWTSGIDNVIVDALKTANHRSCRSSAPTTPASSSSSSTSQGLKGAAVTNPAAVGGAGVVLGDPDPRRQEAGRRRTSTSPRSCGTTPPTKARPSSTAAADPSLPDDLAARPHDQGLDDLRQATAVKACKGPGES